MLNVFSTGSGNAESPQQAAANLSALIESTEDLIGSVDLSFRLLTFNSALRRHLELDFDAHSAIGMRAQDLLLPARAALWLPLFERALAQGPFRIELPFSEGQTFEMAFNLVIADGRTNGISIFGKDISARKRTEMELRENAASLRQTQRIGGLGSYVLDLKSGVWTCSDFLEELLGIDRDADHTLESWLAQIHPEDRAMMEDYFANEVVGKRGNFDKEYRLNRANDKEQRWIHALGQMEYGEGGEPLSMRGVIKDITERKLADIHLRESEERYRATFEQAAVGIIHCSFEGRILRSNARFTEITGYPLEEILGMTFQQITSPGDLEETERLRLQLGTGSRATGILEKRYQRKDGSLTWVKLTISTQRDGEGNPLHAIALVEDINARKDAEQKLAAAQQALLHSEERYRTAFQTSLDAINITRLDDGTYIECNKAFLDIVGFAREEVIGHTSLELGIWADVRARQKMVDALGLNGSIRDLEALLKKKNGELFWGIASASAIEIEGVVCVLSITRDVTEAKAAGQRLSAAADALRVSEERYRKVFQTSLDPITITRIDNKQFLEVNQAFLRTTGFQRDEIIGRTAMDLGIWTHARDLDTLDAILDDAGECHNMEYQFTKKNGETLWGLMSASIIEIEGVRCSLTITRDISSAKAAEAEIRNLAFYDPLTGLANRRLLLERLHQSLAVSDRTGRKRALLFLDLDDFKTLNDTLGHQTGDLMLQEAARRLQTCVREIDTVGRLGGDEFVLMLEDLNELPEEAAAHARGVAERILAAFDQSFLLDGRECRTSASIGIAIFGAQRESASQVLQQADIAMYQAKAAGRNAMRFFAPALQTAVTTRAALEDDLRVATQTGQFVLHYQPQIDRNRLVGAEALIRWRHPLRGILPPGEFIPLAEENGLILPLGKWVLGAACAQIAAWAGRSHTASLSISVNISARQFRQPDFVQQVLDALERAAASPNNLWIELTESLLVENVDDVVEKMTELKSHGVRFALDDFGTGYSSLAYLKRLPLNQLKIDRSFIRDILSDESSAAIAQTIISLSRAMGLPVIAEGVETEEQRLLLVRLGCHAFQGFLFSRPLPLDEFEDQWLAPRAASPLRFDGTAA